MKGTTVVCGSCAGGEAVGPDCRAHVTCLVLPLALISGDSVNGAAVAGTDEQVPKSGSASDMPVDMPATHVVVPQAQMCDIDDPNADQDRWTSPPRPL